MNEIYKETQGNEANTLLPAVLFGYIILRNLKFGVKSPNSTEWEQMETGFQLDYAKKKLYKCKYSAEDALKQLKKHTPNDEFEIHPVYWYGR
jgi:hypothetical protein